MEEDYYDSKQSRTLTNFKHNLIVVGIFAVVIIIFEIGLTMGSKTSRHYYELLNPVEQKIEVGQTWTMTLNENDPFKKVIVVKKRVIAVKNDYVLYIRFDNDTVSDQIHYFLIGSELLNTDTINKPFKLEYTTIDESIPKYNFKSDFIKN